LLFNPEDGGDMSLQNVSELLLDYMVYGDDTFVRTCSGKEDASDGVEIRSVWHNIHMIFISTFVSCNSYQSGDYQQEDSIKIMI
jgi:hypothetical protein